MDEGLIIVSFKISSPVLDEVFSLESRIKVSL